MIKRTTQIAGVSADSMVQWLNGFPYNMICFFACFERSAFDKGSVPHPQPDVHRPLLTGVDPVIHGSYDQRCGNTILMAAARSQRPLDRDFLCCFLGMRESYDRAGDMPSTHQRVREKRTATNVSARAACDRVPQRRCFAATAFERLVRAGHCQQVMYPLRNGYVSYIGTIVGFGIYPRIRSIKYFILFPENP